MDNRHERLPPLFAAALDVPEDTRGEFLERACADDFTLRRQIDALLAMDADLGDVTARRVAPALISRALATRAQVASWSGLRVGPFQVREELGRGGMGVVYRAERVDGTVAQQVAIKFVRRDALDANTRRRFELERQMLASLDHPNIARLIDAAELADGTPYYVMEYVAGEPITQYCERAQLDLRARVELLRKVCGAVAAAHRALIVHRDLKPSNILIAAGGAPKLLDFGIAKALSPATGVATEETGTALRYFSPQYAAPEQFAGRAVGVACDVYALGLLAFELLSGARPFDFTGLTHGQIERLIADVPPAPPSVLRVRASRASCIAAKDLRGDLDGIVLKCLRKDPRERYASVEQLESDLASWLAGRPVSARGGQRWYRLQKFVGRNKAGVAAGALVAGSLLAGFVGFAWQAQIAQRRAAELDAVARFQSEMLTNVDPARAGEQLTATVTARLDAALAKRGVPDAARAAKLAAFAQLWREINATDTAGELIDKSILEPAAAAVDERFGDQPIAGAALRQGLADSYHAMGWYERAMPLQALALAARREHLGDTDPDTAYSFSTYALLLDDQGRGADAEPHYRAALAAQRARLGAADEKTLATVVKLSDLLADQERYAEAEPLLRDTLATSRAALGDDHEVTLRVINNLGFLLRAQGRLDEAEPFLRESLERRRRVLGEDDVATLTAVNNLGLLLRNQGRHAEAERYFRDALAGRRRVLGEDAPDTLVTLTNVGVLVHIQGRLEESEPFLVETAEKHVRVLGPEHPDALRATYSLGYLRFDQRRYADAEPLLRVAYDGRVRALGAAHSDTIGALAMLARTLLARGREADAAALLEPAEPAARAAFARSAPHRLSGFLVALGRARAALGNYGAAERALLEGHALLRDAPGANPDQAPDCARALAELYVAWDAAKSAPQRSVRDVDSALP